MQFNVVVVPAATLGYRSDRMTHAKTAVPQSTQKLRDSVLHLREIRLQFNEKENVYIGIGKQLATAIPSHRGNSNTRHVRSA